MKSVHSALKCAILYRKVEFIERVKSELNKNGIQNTALGKTA